LFGGGGHHATPRSLGFAARRTGAAVAFVIITVGTNQ
jgi:hypothetical protein